MSPRRPGWSWSAKPSMVTEQALIQRYRELHSARYRDRRSWDEDLGRLLSISPYIVRAWHDGKKKPEGERLEKVILLLRAMETGMALRMTPELDSRRVQDMRRAGIKWVEVLGCSHPPEECDAYRAMRGVLVEIEYAPGLPLPGCDLLECKCILLAREGQQ